MYLGIASIVTRRKVSRCRRGPCGRNIEQGERAITVVRKGSKGRSYRWFHLECFVLWAEHLYERRRRYHAENPPTRSGRPMGSAVKDKFESDPELAQERHKCIRDRARLLRYILRSDNDEKIDRWTLRIDELERRIKEILPLQVVAPGKRTRADSAVVESKRQEAGLRMRPERATPRKPVARPERTPEELAEIEERERRMFEDWEQRDCQGTGVVVEDGVGQEDGGKVFRGYKEDGEV